MTLAQHPWFLALRPKTLPAAAAPVLVGGAAAAGHDFALLPFMCALATSFLLQIGVNLANDYFDGLHGIDTPDRLGPQRVIQSGLVTPEQMRRVMLAVFAAIILLGIYLITVGGWPIGAIGLASVAAALAYSGGPYPLASNGLGDLFVFIFFGPVAVCGTQYVVAGVVTPTTMLSSLPVGFLITAILVVNNLRDIDTDRRACKRTLAVMVGPGRTRKQFTALLALAYAVVFGAVIGGNLPLPTMLIFLTAWPAVRRIREIYSQRGRALNILLADTAKLAFLFSLFLAMGLLWARI